MVGTIIIIFIVLELSVIAMYWRTNDDYQKAIKYCDDSRTLRILIHDKLEREGTINMEDWVNLVKDAHDLW